MASTLVQDGPYPTAQQAITAMQARITASTWAGGAVAAGDIVKEGSTSWRYYLIYLTP